MLTFSELCEHIDDIFFEKNKENKKHKLEYILNTFRGSDSHNGELNTMFSILRLLLPQIDKNRTKYGLREYSIGKVITSHYQMDSSGEHFKKINIQSHPDLLRTSDFGYLVYTVIKTYEANPPSHFNIEEINEFLTEMSHETKSSDVLRGLLEILSPREIKWLIKIILKDVRLGLETETILSLYHPKAIDLYKHNNNLFNIMEALNKNESKIDLNIKLFQFIRPMLSIKATKKLFNEIDFNNKIIEEKFDGERFQMHCDLIGNKFKWFSRTGNDYHESFTELNDIITKSLNSNISNFILDGEMLFFDPEKQEFCTKGYNYDVKKKLKESKMKKCFIYFDIIFYNNQELLHKTFEDRREIINNQFKDVPGVFLKSKLYRVNSLEDVVNKLNLSISLKWEGLVMKDPKSFYWANERSRSWIKIKAEYFDNFLTELDLVIVGGYYGKGRESGKIKTFLLAVTEKNTENYIFHTVALSGLGLTNIELKKLEVHLKPFYQKRTKIPSNIRCGREKPDFWIRPENSKVLEIKASELHRASGFATSYTLRFPRIVRVRYDKTWIDGMTLDEFNEIISQQGGAVIKLFKKTATVGDFISVPEIKIKQESSPITIQSDKLANKEFMVFTGTNDINVEEIRKLIQEHGGTVVEIYGLNTFCGIAGEIDFRVQTEIKLAKKNIVTVDWLMRQVSSDEDVSWEPWDIYSLSKTKQIEMNINYDPYGDHYTKPATVDSLKYCIEKITSQNLQYF